ERERSGAGAAGRPSAHPAHHSDGLSGPAACAAACRSRHHGFGRNPGGGAELRHTRAGAAGCDGAAGGGGSGVRAARRHGARTHRGGRSPDPRRSHARGDVESLWRRQGRGAHCRHHHPPSGGVCTRHRRLAAVRILQQCIYFPPEVGGLESHAYYLCRELVRMGHHVTMATSLSQPGLRERDNIGGVRAVRRWFPRERTPAGWAAHTLATVPHYMRLARHADILHAQTFASALPAMRAKRKLGLPLVITLHTSHFLKLAKKPTWRPVLRRIVKSADWLLAASEEIRDVALDLHPHKRAEALTNGVDTGLFVPLGHRAEGSPIGTGSEQDERPRVIVPRRLFEKNGVEYFIRALPLIREQLEIDAVLVGDGPERPRLEKLVSELGV